MYVCVYIYIYTVEINTLASPKIGNQSPSRSRYTTRGCILRMLHSITKMLVQSNVFFIHNSQELICTQWSITQLLKILHHEMDMTKISLGGMHGQKNRIGFMVDWGCWGQEQEGSGKGHRMKVQNTVRIGGIWLLV